jgi:hypothetical protein
MPHQFVLGRMPLDTGAHIKKRKSHQPKKGSVEKKIGSNSAKLP